MLLEIQQIGEVPYEEGLKLQMEWVEKKRGQPDLPEILLLTEHPSVYTMGKHLTGTLQKKIGEISVLWVQRRGGITYHDKGQLILYAIVNLKRNSKTLKDISYDLESIALHFLENFQLKGERLPQHPGVWINGKLIAMIGLGVHFGMTYHGMAINLNIDLKPFQDIAPCGLASSQISSVKELIGKDVDMEKAYQQITQSIRTSWG